MGLLDRFRRRDVDPLAVITAAKLHFKKVTGKDFDPVAEILLVKLLANWKELNLDPKGRFADSYAFDLLMIISKWTLGKDFRGTLLINSVKQRQEYLNPEGNHYRLLKGAGIGPVDVVPLFKSEKIDSIARAFDSTDKLILCDVGTYKHLVESWPVYTLLNRAMSKPAIQTINQEELLSQFIIETRNKLEKPYYIP